MHSQVLWKKTAAAAAVEEIVHKPNFPVLVTCFFIILSRIIFDVTSFLFKLL